MLSRVWSVTAPRFGLVIAFVALFGTQRVTAHFSMTRARAPAHTHTHTYIYTYASIHSHGIPCRCLVTDVPLPLGSGTVLDLSNSGLTHATRVTNSINSPSSRLALFIPPRLGSHRNTVPYCRFVLLPWKHACLRSRHIFIILLSLSSNGSIRHNISAA
jgi:hypothetical protein